MKLAYATDTPNKHEAQILAWAGQGALQAPNRVLTRETGRMQERSLDGYERVVIGLCLDRYWLTVDGWQLTELGRIALHAWVAATQQQKAIERTQLGSTASG